jgi:hypothetical protein
MPIENLGHEHEFEPQFGLPERLPSDEHILWQGSPDLGALASSAFHIKKLVIYFIFLIGACAWPALEAGAGVMAVLQAIKWIAPLTLLGLGAVWILAYLTTRTTVYTLTNKRVVMRLGIVLTVTFNFPLKQIASSDVRILDGSFGDVTLSLQGTDQIAWIHLWPSVRSWRISKPEPTLRAIPDAQAFAIQFRDAWMNATGLPAHAIAAAETSQRQTPQLQANLT